MSVGSFGSFWSRKGTPFPTSYFVDPKNFFKLKKRRFFLFFWFEKTRRTGLFLAHISMVSRWWQLKSFFYFQPEPWGRFHTIPILTFIFVKGVGSTTNKNNTPVSFFTPQEIGSRLGSTRGTSLEQSRGTARPIFSMGNRALKWWIFQFCHVSFLGGFLLGYGSVDILIISINCRFCRLSLLFVDYPKKLYQHYQL